MAYENSAEPFMLRQCEPTKHVIETFEQYSTAVTRHAQYPLEGSNLLYPATGCAGEAGELLDKIKKHWRNNSAERLIAAEEKWKLGSINNVTGRASITEDEKRFIVCNSMSAASLTAEEKIEIIKEAGDVLWYLNAIANELGVTLGYIATANADKLADRAARNVIKSQGDNR